MCIRIYILAVVISVFVLFPILNFSQEDLARQDELPSRIGAPRCTNSVSGRDATLQGSLTVRGTSNSGVQPAITIAVYGGGIFFRRQKMRNGGSFALNCIPRENVSLVVEINSVEVEWVQLGNLQSAPYINRQDVFVSWSETGGAKQKTGVVSADNYYERTEKNQKLFEKAIEAASKAQTSNAVQNLETLVANDPSDYIAWTQLGNFYFNDANFAKAVSAYDRAAALKSSYLAAMIGGGRANIALMNFDRSAEILQKAVEAYPNSPDANHYAGEAYFLTKRASLAIPYFRKAIELDPKSKAIVRLRIASICDAAGSKDLASGEYKLLLLAIPDYPDRKMLEKYIEAYPPKQ